ncbi:hypothetical protein [Amycolatopsis anabasis]|uniref:hypothetical protein n=1 Tax=Amycolatopsis anabasis TaxID=1840409 RepID=UPI00131B3613|nr:hypothetical protein [Amycolatopsis anabasis]
MGRRSAASTEFVVESSGEVPDGGRGDVRRQIEAFAGQLPGRLGRGSVVCLRYDGHYGLVSAVGLRVR